MAISLSEMAPETIGNIARTIVNIARTIVASVLVYKLLGGEGLGFLAHGIVMLGAAVAEGLLVGAVLLGQLT